MKRRALAAGVMAIVAMIGWYMGYLVQSRAVYASAQEKLTAGDYRAAVAQLERLRGRRLCPYSSRAAAECRQALWRWFSDLDEESRLSEATEPALLLFALHGQSPEAVKVLSSIAAWPANDALGVVHALRDRGFFAEARRALEGIARASASPEWADALRPRIEMSPSLLEASVAERHSLELTATISTHWEPVERITIELVSDRDGRIASTRPSASGRVYLEVSELSVARDSVTYTVSPTKHVLTLRAIDSAGERSEVAMTVTVIPHVDVRVPVGDYNQASFSFNTGAGVISSALVQGPAGITYKHLGFDGGRRLVHFQIEAGPRLAEGIYWIEVEVTSAGRRVGLHRLQVDVFRRDRGPVPILSREPEVDVQNKTHLALRLVLEAPNAMVIELPPGGTQRLRLTPGRTCFRVSAPSDPSVTPLQGCHEFEPYTGYTWTFFIRNTVVPTVPTLPGWPWKLP